MYSALKLNKQGDSVQPCRTPFPVLNQSVVPWTDCLPRATARNQPLVPLLLVTQVEPGLLESGPEDSRSQWGGEKVHSQFPTPCPAVFLPDLETSPIPGDGEGEQRKVVISLS